MMELVIREDVLTEYEKHVLSLGQIIVLAAMRRLKTTQRVARFLRRNEQEIGMVMLRIRQKGILP